MALPRKRRKPRRRIGDGIHKKGSGGNMLREGDTKRTPSESKSSRYWQREDLNVKRLVEAQLGGERLMISAAYCAV